MQKPSITTNVWPFLFFQGFNYFDAFLFLQEIEHLYCENAAVHKNDWIRLQKLYLPIAARA